MDGRHPRHAGNRQKEATRIGAPDREGETGGDLHEFRG